MAYSTSQQTVAKGNNSFIQIKSKDQSNRTIDNKNVGFCSKAVLNQHSNWLFYPHLVGTPERQQCGLTGHCQLDYIL